MTNATIADSSCGTLLTVSWDDGFPADLRVGEMMARHGIKGTFYIPIHNREGLPVLSLNDLRQLASLHEIGSHTYSHRYLNTASAAEAQHEITSGKAVLEDRLGQAVAGFAYPGGKFRRTHVVMVRNAGFSYARGIQSCRADLAFNRFTMPTTLQICPHTRWVYLRNFLRQGNWRQRAPLFARLMRERPWTSRLVDCCESVHARRAGGVIHFWGHSWELDRFGAWKAVDDFFRYVAEIPGLATLQNRDVAMRAR